MPEPVDKEKQEEEVQQDKPGRAAARRTFAQASVICSHPNASLGQRFCPDCGQELDGPSRESVEEVVEGVLLRHGLILGEGQAEKPDPDEALRQEYGQYEAAPRKWWESSRYSDFEEFKAAPPNERKKELAKYGIKAAWVPKGSQKVTMG
jgi:hypothetical protein